jgi:hypothetical protein
LAAEAAFRAVLDPAAEALAVAVRAAETVEHGRAAVTELPGLRVYGKRVRAEVPAAGVRQEDSALAVDSGLAQ